MSQYSVVTTRGRPADDCGILGGFCDDILDQCKWISASLNDRPRLLHRHQWQSPLQDQAPLEGEVGGGDHAEEERQDGQARNEDHQTLSIVRAW